MKNMKFATKLLLIILAVSVVSMIAISIISYTALLNLSGYSQDINTQLGFYASDSSKEALIGQAESYLSRLSKSQADNCNQVLLEIQDNILSMSNYMGQIYKNSENFSGRELPRPDKTKDGVPSSKIMIAKTVADIEALRGEMLLVSNAEYMFSSIFASNISLNNTYLGTKSGISYRYSTSNAYNPDYDPRERPWYISAYQTDTPIWLDTYVDSYGAIGTTCAMSFYGKDGTVAGVVAVDILLSTMIDAILDVRIGETGYAFLLDKHGNYLAHPKYDELDPAAIDTAQGEYKSVLESMAFGETDVRAAVIDGVDYYIAYAPLSVTGWSMGIMVEQEEVVAGALAMKIGIDNQALEAKDQIRRTLNNVMFRFIVLLCISIVAVLILSILISGSVTKPITKLTNSVILVGHGNLDEKIIVKPRDEIGVLADSFNKMTDDLKNYIADLSKVTAEKERIATELSVATQIQADMLPNIFPAFPGRKEFEVYATMQPAKEVGGDFYDFFMIDDDHLCIVVADVSGKSVPAALFMVIAKTLINNRARAKEEPQDVFINVNKQLCEGNETAMFVTAWMGVLTISSRKMTYVNAGHNPPLLKRVNGQFEYLKTKKGFVLAGMDGFLYKQLELQLDEGDTLYLYTDGVTEANNTYGELYGEERLQNTLNRLSVLTPTKLLPAIKTDIDLFAGGAPQFDDITMLAIRLCEIIT